MTAGNEELIAAIDAAREAGTILQKNFGKKYRVIRKSPREMVSVVDMKAQKAICEILGSRFPGYGIFSEEKTPGASIHAKNWIVDPLDGTHNYIAGLPFSGVSIALARGNEFELGVIFFPMEERMYHAAKGKGAYLNNRKISVSTNGRLSKAMVAYDNQFHLDMNSFAYFKRLTERAFTTRIMGTATNDICWTAEGKIDGRIWVNTKICDIAAGIVILSEAGGQVSNFDGSPCTMESRKVVASNGHIHRELLAVVDF